MDKNGHRFVVAPNQKTVECMLCGPNVPYTVDVLTQVVEKTDKPLKVEIYSKIPKKQKIAINI